MEAGGRLVVGDAHLRAGVGQRFERLGLGAVGVGSGEQPDVAAVVEVATKRCEHGCDAREADEGDQHVDAVG